MDNEYQRLRLENDQLQIDITNKQSIVASSERKVVEHSGRISQLEEYLQRHAGDDGAVFAEVQPPHPPELAGLRRRAQEVGDRLALLGQRAERQAARQREHEQQVDAYKRGAAQAQAALEHAENRLSQLRQRLADRCNNANKRQQHVNGLSPCDRRVHQTLADNRLAVELVAAAVSVRQEFEAFNDVIQRYITPADIAVLACDRQHEHHFRALHSQVFVEHYRRQVFISHVEPTDISQKIADIARQLGRQVVYLYAALQFESLLARTAMIIRKQVDRVVIIQDIADTDAVLEQCPELIILPQNTSSVVRIIGGNITSSPIYARTQGSDYGQSSLYCFSSKNDMEIR